MANDLQKKSKQTAETGKTPFSQQMPNDHPAKPETSPFTEGQRQILGNVYRLILSWRHERPIKAVPRNTIVPAHRLPAEKEA